MRHGLGAAALHAAGVPLGFAVAVGLGTPALCIGVAHADLEVDARAAVVAVSDGVAAAGRVLAGLSPAALLLTDLEGALTARDADAILRAVDRIGGRLDAIEAELAASADPGRRVTRLETLRDADLAALDEVRELAEMLATELTLARHGRGDGVEPLIVELRARVEALQNS